MNLIALTAREFVQHDRLYYPGIYGDERLATLDPPGTPATQHPPMFPFLAGLLGKLAGSDDTFSLLKLIDEAAGIALLGLAVWLSLKPNTLLPSPAGRGVGGEVVAAALIALSPLLVDYSANGSPYILVALALALATLLLATFHRDCLRDYALAGLVCGIGLQAHSVLLALPLAFLVDWILERRSLRWRGVALFFAVLIVVNVPWMAWNLANVGRLFYSSSPDYAMSRLGLSGGGNVGLSTLARYLRLLFATAKSFTKSLFFEAGPFALLLAAAGGYLLLRRDRRRALTLALPTLAYLLMVFIWPAFKYRFLVPLLPPLFALAGYGFARAADLWPGRAALSRALAGLLLAGALIWNGAGFFNNPPTRYYAPADEAALAPLYDVMKPLAVRLGGLPPGMVLTAASNLDTGIETVYWSRLPFVAGGGLSADDLRQQAQKYRVRYVWVDSKNQPLIEQAFPAARIALEAMPFFIYEIDAN